MKYKRFEDLPVWQDAIELSVRIFELKTGIQTSVQTEGPDRKRGYFRF